ncbi:MAG: hypothetical protein JXM69_02975 [Anaerolineae bacterium]|nr:hypothetical protein [Anaerolineae bacterium]
MEEETHGANRLFVILAISLIGLLVLGLLGVGGVFVIRQNLQGQEQASRPTPTLIIRLPNPTATPAPIVQQPKETPAPTPTNTPVVIPGDGQEAAVGGGQGESSSGPKLPPTRTPAPKAEEAGVTVVPETGLGGLEIVLIAVGLIAVFFIARRMRMAS